MHGWWYQLIIAQWFVAKFSSAYPTVPATERNFVFTFVCEKHYLKSMPNLRKKSNPWRRSFEKVFVAYRMVFAFIPLTPVHKPFGCKWMTVLVVDFKTGKKNSIEKHFVESLFSFLSCNISEFPNDSYLNQITLLLAVRSFLQLVVSLTFSTNYHMVFDLFCWNQFNRGFFKCFDHLFPILSHIPDPKDKTMLFYWLKIFQCASCLNCLETSSCCLMLWWKHMC